MLDEHEAAGWRQKVRKNNNSVWRSEKVTLSSFHTCTGDQIQMLCLIFPPHPHCLSLHIQTKWSCCLKRFPPIAEYSFHCSFSSLTDSSSNIFIYSVSCHHLITSFFVLFFNIYFIQIYNPKFRNLIYMEKFFFLLKVTIKPPHKPTLIPNKSPISPFNFHNHGRKTFSTWFFFFFIFECSEVWLGKQHSARKHPKNVFFFLFLFLKPQLCFLFKSNHEKVRTQHRRKWRIIEGRFWATPEQTEILPGKSLKNWFRKHTVLEVDL